MSANPRALVAEDDPEMRTTVSEALALRGYGVVRAESGAEFIEQLANEGPFDLIVTDVSMPWMDGLKAMSTMRTAGVATPVIVMTALSNDAISGQVQALGRAILLRKPFELDELDAAVERLTA
jgi:CheY-like chemotaxis protein